MTLAEGAKYLRVYQRTIHDMLRKNRLPAFKVGRGWRFTHEEIDAWVRAHGLLVRTYQKRRIWARRRWARPGRFVSLFWSRVKKSQFVR